MNKASPQPLYCTFTLTDKQSVDMLEGVFMALGGAVLSEEIEQGKDKGKWLIKVITESDPSPLLQSWQATLAPFSLTTEIIAPKNWLTENIKLFDPISAGRFYIYGSHIKTPPPKNKIALEVDAATAFGSGRHQTTKGCLLALDGLAKNHSFKPQSVLDMGCGTGILAMAAARIYNKPCLAIDIDSEAVKVARHTIKNNHLSSLIKAEKGNGYKTGTVTKSAPFDLIFANILAKPLTLMAKDLEKHLSVNGLAILSGLLSSQESWVLSAHALAGLHLVNKISLGEWSTLIVSKTGKFKEDSEARGLSRFYRSPRGRIRRGNHRP